MMKWRVSSVVESLIDGMIEFHNRRMLLVKLSKCRMVEWWSWWSCQLVEWWNGRVVDWLNVRMVEFVKFSDHRSVEWCNGGVVESSSCEMVELLEWSNPRKMECWKCRLVEWWNGWLFVPFICHQSLPSVAALEQPRSDSAVTAFFSRIAADGHSSTAQSESSRQYAMDHNTDSLHRQHAASFKNMPIAAVYVDQSEENNLSSNLVVSGIEPKSTVSDRSA